MIETLGLGAGSYPEPNEVYEEDNWLDDFDSYMSDINHEEMMLGKD